MKKKRDTESWISQLIPIIEECEDGDTDPLDGDDVDRLSIIIKAKLNLFEGNITEKEYLKQIER